MEVDIEAEVKAVTIINQVVEEAADITINHQFVEEAADITINHQAGAISAVMAVTTNHKIEVAFSNLNLKQTSN